MTKSTSDLTADLTADLERARSLAVLLEQELARVTAERDALVNQQADGSEGIIVFLGLTLETDEGGFEDQPETYMVNRVVEILGHNLSPHTLEWIACDAGNMWPDTHLELDQRVQSLASTTDDIS